MKKLLTIRPAGIFIFAGLSLAMILGSFWHYQSNQTQLGRLSVLNQGLGTCFNRVSQTFTAMMISDLQSPYVKSEFTNLSDECLSEAAKGSVALKSSMGKAYENLNQLISETHWFHEKIGRLQKQKDISALLAPVSDRYGRMENYRQTLSDEIDSTSSLIRKVQRNDEFLMGMGLIMFVIALSLLSLQEYQRFEMERSIEREALSYLTMGKANLSSVVDRLVDNALTSQNMPVTAQIFRDYHGDVLERMAGRISTDVSVAQEGVEENLATPVVAERSLVDVRERTSLKEALVTLQSLQSKEDVHISELRDVQLLANSEGIEHMMNAAVNALLSHRKDDKKIMIGTQVHSDRVILNFFLGGCVFSATELEYASNPEVIAEGLDMNLQILKEMVALANAQWFIDNKVDRHGKITGMNIRLILDRAMKENRSKNLVSVMKGKKKDLAKTLSH
jgi:hypothetical protein